MIAQLSGDVVDKTNDHIVVEVSGVGYEVLMSELDLDQLSIGDDIRLHTYMHVRENSQELFGFSSAAAKQLFQLLISVNGVGPKGALALMSLGEDKQIKSAIAAENVAFLTGASGIGKKAAEKIIVELKDKVGPIVDTVEGSGSSSSHDEAHQALTALGYSSAHATKALSHVDAGLPTEERVRKALKGAGL